MHAHSDVLYLLLAYSVVVVPTDAWGGGIVLPHILHIPMEIWTWRSSTWGVGWGLHGDLDGGAGWVGQREPMDRELHGEELDGLWTDSSPGTSVGRSSTGPWMWSSSGTYTGRSLMG
jgi:hypothetical protein